MNYDSNLQFRDTLFKVQRLPGLSKFQFPEIYILLAKLEELRLQHQQISVGSISVMQFCFFLHQLSISLLFQRVFLPYFENEKNVMPYLKKIAVQEGYTFIIWKIKFKVLETIWNRKYCLREFSTIFQYSTRVGQQLKCVHYKRCAF